MVLDNLDTRTRSFLLSLLVNLGIAIICFLVFSIIRSRCKHIFEPRLNHTWRNLYRCYVSPPPIPSGFFSWIKITYQLTDQEIYEMAGLDALMYIRFLGTVSRLFLYSMIPAVAIAIPIYFTANNMIRDPTNDRPGYVAYTRPDDFSQLSLANVENGSARMVFTLLFLWGFTILALYMSLELWVTYMHYRHVYIATRQIHGHGMTLLIRNIPHTYKNNAITEFLQQIFDKYVVNITLVHDTYQLHKLIEQRNNEIATVEKAYWTMENHKQGKRPVTYTKYWCCQKMDAIHHHSHEITNLNHEIAKYQQYHSFCYPAAFVTINSAILMNTLPRANLNDHIDHWQMKQAPDPDDVDYRALRFNGHERYVRYLIFTSFTILLIFFWSIPTAIASSFANLQGLADYVSWLHWIHDIPTGLINLVQAYLPSIILFLFLYLLPIILTWFAEQKGIAAFTWQQYSVVRAMFVFMVVNYFLVFTFAGSIINQLSAIIKAPLSLPQTLGVAVPAQATAFVEIILFRGLLGFPVQALAIGNLISALQYRYLAKTPREQWTAVHPSDLLYGNELPTQLFVLVLGFVYVNIHPLVTVFASVYFLLGYIVTKYQLIYMIVPRHESGGQHWPIIFTRYIICLIVAQLTMIGLFGVKQSFEPMALSVPLPFITLIFYVYVLQNYGKTAQFLPFEHAILIDQQHKNFDNIVPTPRKLQEIEQKQQDELIAQPTLQHDMQGMDVPTRIQPIEVPEKPGHGRHEDRDHDIIAALRLPTSNIPCHISTYVQYEKYSTAATIPTSWEWSNRELDWENRYHIDVDPQDPETRDILPSTRRGSHDSIRATRHDPRIDDGGSRDTSVLPTYDHRHSIEPEEKSSYQPPVPNVRWTQSLPPSPHIRRMSGGGTCDTIPGVNLPPSQPAPQQQSLQRISPRPSEDREISEIIIEMQK